MYENVTKKRAQKWRAGFSMGSKVKIALLVLLDTLAINVSIIAALLLRFDFNTENTRFQALFNVYLEHAVILTVLGIIAIAGNRLYASLWKYVSLKELGRCFVASISGLAANLAYFALVHADFSKSVLIYAFGIEFLLISIIRFAYRILREYHVPGMFNVVKDEAQSRVLLIGAGDAGSAMISELNRHPEENKRIVVAIDDDRTKIGRDINGVKIVGDRNAIPEVAGKYEIDEIIVAIPTASKAQIKDIVEICQVTKLKVQILPGLIDLINEKVSVKALRDVAIEDLLGRDQVELNMKEIAGYIEGQTVLVTGGGGSIGSEIARQLANYGPRRVVVFDIYENTSFELQQELKMSCPNLDLKVEIGSVVSETSVDSLFNKYRPAVIFHAAAHKHVPLMEDTPYEAVLNNVYGTSNVMNAAERYNAKQFVLISTDKAVNPTSVMGATKRICEMLMQDHAAKTKSTKFVAVRFGNVLGSNGSVIPTFKKQIAAGGPVTVTHKDITRYFMTIPEAVQLVLEAGSMAKGGEIFILDMGEPVKILDLAEKLIRLSGSEPYRDIPIKFTGLRPGEKLYEELLLSEEGIKETSHGKIYIGKPITPSEGFNNLVKTGLKINIQNLAYKNDEEVRDWIKCIVANYNGGGTLTK